MDKRENISPLEKYQNDVADCCAGNFKYVPESNVLSSRKGTEYKEPSGGYTG